MEADKDNANPTILNASDLPSRRPNEVIRPRDDGSTGLFDGLLPSTRYTNDPFETSTSSDDEDSDDAEAIDSQEIYGPSPFPHTPHHSHANGKYEIQISSHQYPTPNTPSPSAALTSSNSTTSTSSPPHPHAPTSPPYKSKSPPQSPTAVSPQ